jgi:hypothetical protein
MTRVLLTLLALLTGLFAQIAPTQARIGAASGAEVAVQLPSISSRAAIVSKAPTRPASGGTLVLVPVQRFTPQRTAPTATVLTGIDRARE